MLNVYRKNTPKAQGAICRTKGDLQTNLLPHDVAKAKATHKHLPRRAMLCFLGDFLFWGLITV